MTNSILEIDGTDAMLVIGSNTTETHPVIGLRMKQAVKNHGTQIIVADPRRIKLTDHARLWLSQKPGSDAALINGLCHVIIRDNLVDQDFIKTRTENFEAFAESTGHTLLEQSEDNEGVFHFVLRRDT